METRPAVILEHVSKRFGTGMQSVAALTDLSLRIPPGQYLSVMGQSGSGTTMKLVVNTLLGVNMQAIAEAVAFGEKAGLGRALLLRVLAKTAVIAAAHQNKLLRAERDDYSPQFPLRLMNKDFGLILDKAAELGAPMPATAAAHQIFAARTAVNGNEDFSSVIDEMEHQARVRRNSEPVDELSRLAR